MNSLFLSFSPFIHGFLAISTTMKSYYSFQPLPDDQIVKNMCVSYNDCGTDLYNGSREKLISKIMSFDGY
jgi:hypothetical protein